MSPSTGRSEEEKEGKGGEEEEGRGSARDSPGQGRVLEAEMGPVNRQGWSLRRRKRRRDPQCEKCSRRRTAPVLQQGDCGEATCGQMVLGGPGLRWPLINKYEA